MSANVVPSSDSASETRVRTPESKKTGRCRRAHAVCVCAGACVRGLRARFHGKTMSFSCTMKPTNAAIATRPCLISACRRKPIVASSLSPQKLYPSPSPRGLKYPTLGLHFPARTLRLCFAVANERVKTAAEE
eukprot:1030180-Prymnesium_polylepis.2